MADAIALPLPPHLRAFVDSEQWTFAKTMPEWPHEYLVRERVGDQPLFEELVLHIRRYGRKGRFYSRSLLYFEEADMLYWTMVEQEGDGSWSYSVDAETIINRCREQESWENRKAAGTLPEDLAK